MDELGEGDTDHIFGVVGHLADAIKAEGVAQGILLHDKAAADESAKDHNEDGIRAQLVGIESDPAWTAFLFLFG